MWGGGRLPALRTHLDCPGCHSNRGRFEVRSREEAKGSALLKISHPSNPTAEDPGSCRRLPFPNFKGKVQREIMGCPSTVSLRSKAAGEPQRAWNV